MKGTVTIKEIQRRCSRCGELYDIPNIRRGGAREILLEYYPCMHCGYEKDHGGNKSGRCRDCAIPFSIIDHHASGRCDRCYIKNLRNETATKTAPIVRV